MTSYSAALWIALALSSYIAVTIAVGKYLRRKRKQSEIEYPPITYPNLCDVEQLPDLYSKDGRGVWACHTCNWVGTDHPPVCQRKAT